jgi:hypothetical protein
MLHQWHTADVLPPHEMQLKLMCLDLGSQFPVLLPPLTTTFTLTHLAWLHACVRQMLCAYFAP